MSSPESLLEFNEMKSSRGILMLAGLIAGFVVGTVFGLYLLYAVVTPESLVTRVNPFQLYANGQSPQYRDVYAARVAGRFVALGGAAQAGALQSARDELGVTLGDVTPQQAVDVIRSAQGVAAGENRAEPNPDTGRFTLQDQQNLTALADRLDAAKGEPIPNAQPRRSLVLPGLLGVLLLSGLAGGLLWLISKMLAGEAPAAPAESVSRGMLRPVRGAPVAPVYEEDEEDTPEDVVESAPAARHVAHPSMTSDGPLAAAGHAAAVARAPETLLGTYNTGFALGDDRYDESFPINGSMGELIGECGATALERAGLETPAKFTTLAVWVFDKTDFQSTTKLLMTNHVYNDAVVRGKLKERGDALEARNGVFEIVTSTMRVEVEVSGLDFGPIDNDPLGFYEKANLQFRVFKKTM